MAAKKKTKRLTNAEKKANAEFKKELIEKGILPPDKPKLNRKKFIEEAEAEWNEREKGFLWEHYLIRAMSYMLAHREKQYTRYSLEAVGAAKVLKLALRLKRFSDELKEQGRDTYKLKEEMEYVQDIIDA